MDWTANSGNRQMTLRNFNIPAHCSHLGWKCIFPCRGHTFVGRFLLFTEGNKNMRTLKRSKREFKSTIRCRLDWLSGSAAFLRILWIGSWSHSHFQSCPKKAEVTVSNCCLVIDRQRSAPLRQIHDVVTLNGLNTYRYTDYKWSYLDWTRSPT